MKEAKFTIELDQKVTLASLEMFVQELINEHGLGSPIHIRGSIEFPRLPYTYKGTDIAMTSIGGNIQSLPKDTLTYVDTTVGRMSTRDTIEQERKKNHEDKD